MNSVKKNYIYNLAYQVLAIIIPIITTPYVSRVLGATALGDYNYTLSIVTYFGIFVLTGTHSYGQREIAVRVNDKYEKSVKFFEIFLFRMVCFLMVILAYLAFVIFITKRFRILFFIHIVTFFSWVLDISWYYQGIENFKYTVFRNSVVKVVATCLIFIAVKNPNDLYKYALILVGSTFLGNCTLWMRVRKEIVFVKLKDIHIFCNSRGIMQLFIPVVAIQIYTVLDQTMIGLLANTTEVGYYSQGEKIIKLSLTIISSLSTVLLPKISNLFSSHKKNEIQGLYNKSVSFLFLLADPMLIGCIIISPYFVPAYYGAGYEPVINILRILSFLFLSLSVGQLYGSFLVALHKQNLYSKAVIYAAILNFVLNFTLMYCFKLGAVGAAIGTISAETVSTMIQVWGARDYFNPKAIFAGFARYLLPSIGMGLVVYIFMNLLTVSMAGLLFIILTAAITYFIVLIVMVKDSNCMEIVSLIKRMAKIKSQN